MENGLLFSIVDFEMYVNDDAENKWFDVDEITTINVKTQLIPLFNTNFHNERDYFDDIVFAELMIVISILEFDGQDHDLTRELISYEYLLEPRESKENVYEISLKISFGDIKKHLEKGHYYMLSTSYYIKDKPYSDLFTEIMNNTFSTIMIPFIEDGGWINGRK